MEHDLNETYKNNFRTGILDNMQENCTIKLVYTFANFTVCGFIWLDESSSQKFH